MSKILKLKEWVSVGDAAKRLSIIAGEAVTEADVLRLALDGHMTLSVYFVNHAKGRAVRIEPLTQQLQGLEGIRGLVAPEAEAEATNFVRKYRGELLPGGQDVLIAEGDPQRPVTLEGVWDLLMQGAEVLDVEHLIQSLTDGPAIELVSLTGPLVTNRDRSKVFQILDMGELNVRPIKDPYYIDKPRVSKDTRKAMDRMNDLLGPVTIKPPQDGGSSRWDYETFYYPASGLPEDSMFVVRSVALRELEEKLLTDETRQEKPLHASERRSAGQIIAALAAMAQLDISAPYAADETLRAVAATNGLELPSSPETVVKFFKDAARHAGKAERS